MAILVPRIRSIGVRLSEYEYSVLEKFCLETGARSISDLARNAILSFIRDANWRDTMASGTTGSPLLIRSLEARVEQLTAEIAQLKAARAPRGTGRAAGKEKTERKEMG